MRKLIAVAMLGAGAAFFATSGAVHATPASGAAGIANKLATQQNAGVHEVRRRWKKRRRYGRRWRGRRSYRSRRYYRPRYYYGRPYYSRRYYRRRPRFGIYFGF